MSSKLLWLCVVSFCLMALAGSLLFARKNSVHRSAPPRAAAKFLAQTPDRHFAARTALVQGIPQHAANPARQTPLSLPFAFEPNVGQIDSRVAFIGRGRGLTVLLERREIAVQIAGTSRAARAGISHGPRAISMRLTGAANFAWQDREGLRGETNYFLGNNPRHWRTHVPHFAEVGAANVAATSASSSTATTKASNTTCASRRAPISRRYVSQSPAQTQPSWRRTATSC